MAKDDDKKPAKGRKRTSAYKLDESSKKKKKDKPKPDADVKAKEDEAAEETAADDNVVDLDEARGVPQPGDAKAARRRRREVLGLA